MDYKELLWEQNEPKLSRIIINNLFGIYNYDIKINSNGLKIENNPLDKNFIPNTTIIYGVNGQGKTTILKLVNAILNCDFKTIESIYFEDCTLVFKKEKDFDERRIYVRKYFRKPIKIKINTLRNEVMLEGEHNTRFQKNIDINILNFGIYGNYDFKVKLRVDASKPIKEFYVDGNGEQVIKNYLQEMNFQTSIYIDSQRLNDSSKEYIISFSRAVKDLNVNIRNNITSLIGGIKHNVDNYNLTPNDIDEMIKMFPFYDKNGWYTYRHSNKIKEQMEKYNKN